MYYGNLAYGSLYTCIETDSLNIFKNETRKERGFTLNAQYAKMIFNEFTKNDKETFTE